MEDTRERASTEWRSSCWRRSARGFKSRLRGLRWANVLEKIEDGSCSRTLLRWTHEAARGFFGQQTVESSLAWTMEQLRLDVELA